MTKRFEMKDPNWWGYPITDNKTGESYSCGSNERMKSLVKVINELNDENQRLSKDKQLAETEVMRIRQSLNEAIETERTQIGQSVLRQLREAIQ